MEGIVEEDCFGVLKKDGRPSELVRRFTLSNKKMSVQVITYGAAITSIKVPDKEGNVDDVVLGFDNFTDYLNHPYYFGCTIGRVANRIAKGSFKIQGVEYRLETNEGEHHLHGGVQGFDKVLWDSHVEGKTVIFSYTSSEWEGNYPGAVDCQVTYSLNVDGELHIRYKATATHFTPINMTNHSYINLGGHGSGKIHSHIINLNADYYTPVNETLIPTGEILSVTNTIYDLRKPKKLKSILANLSSGGLDLNYCTNGIHGSIRKVAKLYDRKSGRVLEISSTQPGVQIYTANSLPTDDSLRGKDGKCYRKHEAICLETQNYPDAVNHPNFPSCILGIGETYSQTTVYNFSIK